MFEAAQRPPPQDAPAELQDARARYGQEAKRRQDLNLAAAHFEQNPEAVDGVAKVLADIGDGKPSIKVGTDRLTTTYRPCRMICWPATAWPAQSCCVTMPRR